MKVIKISKSDYINLINLTKWLGDMPSAIRMEESFYQRIDSYQKEYFKPLSNEIKNLDILNFSISVFTIDSNNSLIATLYCEYEDVDAEGEEDFHIIPG